MSFTEQLGDGATLEMVYIPEGEFLMGSPESEVQRLGNEGPQHNVKVPAFYIGKYPVTQKQWHAVSLMDGVEIGLRYQELYVVDLCLHSNKQLTRFQYETVRQPMVSGWLFGWLEKPKR